MKRGHILPAFTITAVALVGAAIGSGAQKIYDICNGAPEISCYVETGDRFGPNISRYKGRACTDMERRGEYVQYGTNSDYANEYAVQQTLAATQRAERERLEEKCKPLPQPQECYDAGLGLGQ